jgi:hypothetical protein
MKIQSYLRRYFLINAFLTILPLSFVMAQGTTFSDINKNAIKDLVESTRRSLDSIDTKTLTTGRLLNKGLYSPDEIEKLLQLKPGVRNSNIILDSENDFYRKLVRILKTDHSKKGSALRKYWHQQESAFDSLSRKEKKIKNKVPIAVILAEGKLLTPKQLADNLNRVRIGKKTSAKESYKVLPIVSTLPMHKNFTDSELVFEMKHNLGVVDKRFKKTPVKIDIGDGQGFRPFGSNKKI